MDAAGGAAVRFLILTIGCGAFCFAGDLERGTELARAGLWDEARAVLQAGARNAPRDKRFPLELAGLEYRLKKPRAAKRYLRRALKLDPSDRYGNDFLGTLYYLEGNEEAALQHWNRIGKPRIDDVKITPEPDINPVVLDSALAFSPASLLTLDHLRTTRARLDALDVFGAYRLELAAQPEEHFDATLHWLKLPAWLQAASMLRGLAYQTVEPELRDIDGSGLNWTNLLRWDAQKRRASTSLTGPLMHNAKWRYRWFADARKETWNAGGSQDFRLQRIATGAEFEAIPNGTISWRAGFEVSTRHFANLPEFRGGTAAMYRAGLSYELLRLPERRFSLRWDTKGDVGRLISGTGALFASTQASLVARWLPLARGEDYAMSVRVSAGTTQGHAPFDELFILGLERDNDLWLRGHAGTLDGKKGSAPIGRNYFLTNWDLHKQIYRHPLFTIEAGPFLDTGRTNDAFARSAFGRWLIDSGVEGSVRLPVGLRSTIVYGRDLRGGGRVIYLTVGK